MEKNNTSIFDSVSLCQVYFGTEREFVGQSFGHFRKFRAVEVVIHFKYNMKRRRGEKTTYRADYDIALLRIDYPAVDDGNGK